MTSTVKDTYYELLNRLIKDTQVKLTPTQLKTNVNVSGTVERINEMNLDFTGLYSLHEYAKHVANQPQDVSELVAIRENREGLSRKALIKKFEETLEKINKQNVAIAQMPRVVSLGLDKKINEQPADLKKRTSR